MSDSGLIVSGKDVSKDPMFKRATLAEYLSEEQQPSVAITDRNQFVYISPEQPKLPRRKPYGHIYGSLPSL